MPGYTVVCDGRCLSASDLGFPQYEKDWPAYPDPECSLHGGWWCATRRHAFADHDPTDGCGACALAYNRHNPRHDFTPTLPVGDG